MEPDLPPVQRKQRGRRFLGPPSFFIGGTVFFFVLSLALALLGVFYGPHLLRWLKAEGEVDLQTMGELLGGTLGVAVAFAGAWVAFKIATFANHTLVLQERREASRMANETLEQSIGKILSAQLHFEALLRSIHTFVFYQESEEVSPHADERRAQQLQLAKQSIEMAAGELSASVQEILTNPLAISVLFALQEAKPGQQCVSRQQLLEDLSQLPRTADFLKLSLRRAGDRNLMMISPCAMLTKMSEAARLSGQRNEHFRDLRMELGYLTSLHRDAIPTLSLIDCLDSANSEDSLQDFREPFFILVSRYFVYTQDEALQALENLFSEQVYEDSEARKIILNSRPADAFRSSGQINDSLTRSILESSAQTHAKLAVLSGEAKDDTERAQAIRRLVFEGVWGNHLKHDGSLLEALVEESKGLTAFQIYRVILTRGNSRAPAAERAAMVRDELRWMVGSLGLRDKLRRISPVLGQPEYEQTIRNVARLAEAAQLVPQLNRLPLSEADLRSLAPEPAELFENLRDWCNRGVADDLLRHEDAQLREAVIAECQRRPMFPQAVKILCLAVRSYRQQSGVPLQAKDVIASAWGMIEGPPSPEKLAVVCEASGLRADRIGETLKVSDPKTKTTVFATISDAGTFEISFELNSSLAPSQVPATLVPEAGTLQVDGWSISRGASGRRFSKRYDFHEIQETLPRAWRESIAYRNFVIGVTQRGIGGLEESEANIIFLTQMVEAGAKLARWKVAREDNVLHIMEPQRQRQLKVVVGPHGGHVARMQVSFRLGPFAPAVDLDDLQHDLRTKGFLTTIDYGEESQALVVGRIIELHPDSLPQLRAFFETADRIHQTVFRSEDTDVL